MPRKRRTPLPVGLTAAFRAAVGAGTAAYVRTDSPTETSTRFLAGR
jgi:hypothetical protein